MATMKSMTKNAIVVRLLITGRLRCCPRDDGAGRVHAVHTAIGAALSHLTPEIEESPQAPILEIADSAVFIIHDVGAAKTLRVDGRAGTDFKIQR